MRLSERAGGYRVIIFTDTDAARAGPVDVSVFVQDADTGEPAAGVRIMVLSAAAGPAGRGRPSCRDGGGRDEQALPIDCF